MSSLWLQDLSAYSPSPPEIDSSSVRPRERGRATSWPKQEREQLCIKWENLHGGTNSSDVVQDNTPSSAMSSASTSEGPPHRVLLTITKLQCMLERKQERISALERQVEDLMQDRSFLRSQIENLTSSRAATTYAPPAAPAEAPSASKVQHSEPKSRKRERLPSSSSLSRGSDSGGLCSSEASVASSERRGRRHGKDTKGGKKGKDYSRKRATGIKYVIHRYKQVLSAYNKKKNMTKAFRHYGIDRNTIANTAPIAELHLACKDTVPLVGMFRQGEETLVSYAQRCSLVIDSDLELSSRIEHMKANAELLPISAKRCRGLPPHFQPLVGAGQRNLLS